MTRFCAVYLVRATVLFCAFVVSSPSEADLVTGDIAVIGMSADAESRREVNQEPKPIAAPEAFSSRFNILTVLSIEPLRTEIR